MKLLKISVHHRLLDGRYKYSDDKTFVFYNLIREVQNG